jgi:hypothetical protein
MAVWRRNLVADNPMYARILVPAALLALTACASAVPGYVPPPLGGEKKNEFAHAMESGDMRGDRYEMSSTERGMDCKRMTGSMQITISRLKDKYGREEPSSVASSAQSYSGPLFGSSGKGADRGALYARERAKLDAYNEELAAKNCKTLDIEAELARAPDSPGKKY